MTPLLAAVATALILTGILLFVAGIRRTPVPPPKPRRRRTRRGPQLSRRTVILLSIGFTAGLVIAVVTGWLIAVVVLPAAAAGIPALLSSPEGNRRIRRLEAMEEWTRALAGVLTAGVGLEQALVATLRSTPEAIHPEVSTLAARLRSRWTTEAAIRAFADDLDDPTGDLIAATLILGAQRRGAGLASVLEGLAESVAADVRARREIEADRAKPRTTARWVTMITVVLLTFLAATGTYIAPYGTPLGQAMLALFLSMYAAALLWLRQMAKSDLPPRFLGARIGQGTQLP